MLTDVRPMWGVEDFLDRVNCMLDIRKLGHGNFGRHYRCETEGCLIHALSVLLYGARITRLHTFSDNAQCAFGTYEELGGVNSSR